MDILAPLDFRVAEQVIEVPKIVCPPRAARTVLRGPQTADQLVEVPTIISYSSLLQRTPATWLNTEDEPFQWCFRTFSPEEKSANVTRHMGARVPRHVSSSTSSAYGPRTWVDDGTGEVWTLLTDPALGSWWYSSRMHRSQWHPPWGALSLAVAGGVGRPCAHAETWFACSSSTWLTCP